MQRVELEGRAIRATVALVLEVSLALFFGLQFHVSGRVHYILIMV